MPVRQLSLLVVVAALPACDVVWGLSGEPSACELRSFAELDASEMTAGGEQFTVAADKTSVMFEKDSLVFERNLLEDEPVGIELGVYPTFALAIAPEGDLLFHSAALEPPLLQLSARIDDQWVASDQAAPKGVIAGVPSGLDFGPRRVLVRTRFNGTEIQEYEEEGGGWRPVGSPQPSPGVTAPNLTENALVMVFVDVDQASDSLAVLAASRGSRDEWFGAPTVLRTISTQNGTRASAQLIGKTTCDTLFVSQPDALARYDL